MNSPKVKEDKQIVFIHNVHGVFKGITGAEWTNILMWKKGYDNGLNGKQHVLIDGEGNKTVYLDSDVNNRICLTDDLTSILEKVKSKTDKSLSSIMILQNKYDLEYLYVQYPELRNVIGSNGKDKRVRNDHLGKICAFHNDERDGDMKFYGVIRNSRAVKYINRLCIEDTWGNIDKYSVLVATAAGSGNFGDKLSSFIICKPNEGYTQTFIGVGAVDDEKTALIIEKYMKTKFVRTMLYTLKCSQQNSIKTWQNVPLQDFTPESDIDWSVSIPNIDRQLYRKYGLTSEEIDFIETHVKPME